MTPVILFSVAAMARGFRLHECKEPEGRKPPPNALVPFYMYEPPSWTSACSEHWLHHPNLNPDAAFHRQLERHPWRVTNTSEAALFVVPAYISASLQGRCGSHKDNMRELKSMMDNSSSFRRSQGKDHVISAFAWKAALEGALGDFGPQMSGMIVLHFEKRTRTWRRAVVVPYGNIGVGHLDVKMPPLAERQRALFFMGQADSRKTFTTRRIALHKLPPAYYRSALIRARDREDKRPEDLPPCKVPGFVSGCVAGRSYGEYVLLGGQSNYSLVIHGDSPSTSRIYDGIVFDQVPVIVSDGWKEMAMPFSDALPWDSMAVFVSQWEFERSPVDAMRSAVAKASEPSRLQAWRRARGALDWSLEGTCAATAVLLEVADQHLGLELPEGLPEGLLELPDCAAPHAKRRDRMNGTLNETLLEEILMEEKFD